MLQKLKFPSESRKLLILLLSADMGYIFLHILNRIDQLTGWLPEFGRDPFSISFDLGIGESAQYMKEFWIAGLFAWLVFRKRQRAFLGWAFLFFYFLLDDMLSFHENLSVGLANLTGFSAQTVLFANLRVKDLSELAVSAIIGVFLLSLIGIAYLRSKPGTKIVFHSLFVLLAILLFFGVGFDVLDRFFDSQILKGIFGLAEDGGEMLAMSLIVWYVYVLSDKEIEAHEQLPPPQSGLKPVS